MRAVNYSDLKNNLETYFDKVITDSEPLIFHGTKNESVVVMSLEDYNAIMETHYIMSSPKMVEIIREGETEIQNGGGVTVDLDNLWK